jgi:hypothetical protein
MTPRHDARVSPAELALGARLLVGIPAFLRHRISPQQARAIVARRLAQRAPDFLALAQRAIYQHPGSPYRQLLALAGCEYGDLERLIGQEGLDGALRLLYRQGVYLTVDEFKGRRPAIRGSASVAVGPNRLRNPDATVHVPRATSGSRGHGTPAPLDFAHIRERAVNRSLRLVARGDRGWLHALWTVPGGSAVTRMLEYSAVGAPLVRWFSPVDPAAPGLHLRYRWITRVVRFGGLLAGVPQPRPIHVPLDAPLPIARWMAAVLRAGRIPYLDTVVSGAVRLCQAASEAGIDLRGAQFQVHSEPLTPARLAVIRRSGAGLVSTYATTETGPIAAGCLAPQAADDLHVLDDVHGLIQPGADGATGDLPPRALLISSVRPTAPLILLNVSLGDEGDLLERACGCPLEQVGWTRHLHTVRSFEKLTAWGMTFLDTDVIRVLDEILPTRFGGGPTDYQLIEDEAADGQPCVRLLAHPRVGPLDPNAVAEAFLAAIGGGAEGERLMELQWRQAGVLRVERRPPYTTGAGKILHVHLARRPLEETSQERTA